MVTWRLSTLAAGAAVTLLLSGCTSGGSDPQPVDDTAAIKLVAFDSCAETLAELRKAALEAGSPFNTDFARGPVGVPAAPSASGRDASQKAADGAAPEHSGTNNHEAGVDEADLVKTDGKRIVTVADGVLRVVDVASRRLTGKLDLVAPGQRQYGLAASQLLLQGSRALVIVDNNSVGVMYDGATKPVGPGQLPPGEVAGPKLLLVELDGGPRILGSLTVDGGYVDARQIGAVARVIVRSAPRLNYKYPSGSADQQRIELENRAMVARSTAEDWLPRYTLQSGGSSSKGRVGCDQVVHPDGISVASMLTIYTVDLAGALTSGDPLTVLADGETVYASGPHLYIAHQTFVRPMQRRLLPGDQGRPVLEQQRTEVHQFDIAKPGQPRHTASGSVPGTMLNQYSMSEHDGYLRMATTSQDVSPGPSSAQQPRTESAVYVLKQRGKTLAQVGRVGGLGRGEQIHSVRFVGPVGYVVTFRQTDPLYTVDLRDAERPRVTGELKIPGFSAYLHPIDDKTLLGVGQDATAQGQQLGTQISVFDVGDPAAPRQVAKYQLPDGHAEAEFDPHAFLYWPNTGLVVVPVTVPSVGSDSVSRYGYPTTSAVLLTLRDGKLTERGKVQHPFIPVSGSAAPDQMPRDPAIRRALVIGETLWTVSATGIRADGVAGAVTQQQAWLPFA
jgi:hypothetical protein